MKILTILLISLVLFGEKIHETKVAPCHEQETQNKKIKCRCVCDKKAYREKEIARAVSFYKNSKRYRFTKESF